MGVVYAAYDPQLDRKIALKLLKHEGGPEAERARARLLREAQAMARLSHPNVVQVYQAGIHEGRVFLAMEYVRGCTLREWQQQRPRSWREVLEKYIEAARGLAAAHQAELVHRDFKPANVLVETDGRVRVTDFGTAASGSVSSGSEHPSDEPPDGPRTDLANTNPDLATAGQASPWDATVEQVSVASPGVAAFSGGAVPWSARMTNTNTVVGTPAYMSPEQHQAAALDARSDQFSFCVALYEALFDELPFAGNTRAALSANVLAGKLRPLPTGHDVPARILRAVRRGLSRRSQDRFGSMDELVSALRGKGRQVRSLVVGSALVVSLAAWLPTMLITPPPCQKDPAAFEGTWDQAARARLSQHFSHTPAGAALWAGFATNLDQYVDAWQAASVAACRATHVEQRQSEEALDLRMWCLDQRRESVAAHVDTLLELASFDADRLLATRDKLPELETCANIDLLREGYRPPATETERQEIARVRTTLQLVNQRLLLPRGDLAPEDQRDSILGEARAAQAAAKAIGYPPLVAEASYSVGRAFGFFGEPQAAREELERAARLALTSRHTTLVVRARQELAHVLEAHFERSELARYLLDDALAHLERYNANGELRARVLLTKTMLDARAGEFEAAERAVDEYLELARAHPHPWRNAAMQAFGLHVRGNVLAAAGNPPAALEAARAALALAEPTWGEGDLQTARIRFNLALSAIEAGEDEVARAQLDIVNDLFPRYYEPSSALIGNLMVLRAELALSFGELPEARKLASAAVTHADGRLEPQHPDRANPRWALARILVESDQTDSARAVLRELAEITPPSSLSPDDELAYRTLVLRAHTSANDSAAAGAANRVTQLLADEITNEEWAIEGLLALTQWELTRRNLGAAIANIHAAEIRAGSLSHSAPAQLRATIELMRAKVAHADGDTRACAEFVNHATARLRNIPPTRAEQLLANGPDVSTCHPSREYTPDQGIARLTTTPVPVHP
ncbi:MAG: hypothetical protein B7733_04005 [Myxococcales bacterium FL481]|nr:MAG: hypothetical protein B7733_04005 [Myxococcales bacterium FL481]